MQHILQKPEKGNLLVAEPLMGDPNFDRTVILLTEHNDDGSVGFVLNRTLDIKLDTITKDFPSMDAPIYHGGPVQQDNLYFIHRKGDLLPGSMQIAEGVYWGGELEALKEMINCQLIGPQDIRFFLGYSGWEREQLHEETEQKSWLILQPGVINPFEDPAEDMWPKILKEIGGDYQLWAHSPMNPKLN